MTNRLTAALAVAASALGAALLHAQGRGGAEWTTSSFDAQRTGSIRSDPRISVDTMRKPGPFGPFTFLWKLKLEHDPKAAGALTQPILLDRLIGFRGFKSIAFVATASETVHAIDTDVGVPLWKYHINYSASPPPMIERSAACPGGLTAALSRPTAIAPSEAGAGGFGGGRGGRSGGGVGEPGRGATTLATAGRGRGAGPGAPAAPAAPAASAAIPGSAAAAAGVVPGGLPGGARAGGGGGGFGGGPFVPGGDAAYVVGSDGYLHALNVSNGWDNMTPALFLPANTRAAGLIIATTADGKAVAYAETTHGCGSQPDGVWAMDLASPDKTVAAFNANGATIAGTAGPTLGRDGTVYVATMDGRSPLSSSLVALEPRTLKLKASATLPKASLSASPLVLPWKDKDVVIATGGGKLFLFDSASLGGGPIATSPAFGNGAYEASTLASWQDADGTRWIAASHARGIATFKVVEQDGKAVFEPGWSSRVIASPMSLLVVNGVVFTASAGSPAVPAVLHALEAATGKDLWNSGRVITSAIKGGLSAGQGNVYVPGADSTLYAFGFAIEK